MILQIGGSRGPGRPSGKAPTAVDAQYYQGIQSLLGLFLGCFVSASLVVMALPGQLDGENLELIEQLGREQNYRHNHHKDGNDLAKAEAPAVVKLPRQ
jgi:hypothetical protein